MADEDLSTNSFAEMMSGGDDNEQTDEDSQNDEDGQETEQEADQSEEGAEDSEESEEGQEEQPEKDSAEAFLELEINGEKVKVTKEEAKNGYLRQQDYTQKAQNLARERQEAHQHFAQQAAQVQQFSNEIGQLTRIDETLRDYERVDWQALRNEDPSQYGIHLAEYNDLRARRSDVVNAIGQKQQQFAQQHEQAFAQQTQEAQQYLTQKIPGFGKPHLDQMREFGVKHGFTVDELANVTDKRSLEVLWKASEYDKAQATTKKAVKAIAALPTKANKPAPAIKPDEVSIDKQVKRVKQSGSVKDFGALLGMTRK